MDKKENKLIFVYNADSGFFSEVFDLGHKIFSPKTYPCSLCAITYSNLGMRKEWKTFIKELPIKSEFLHKDQLKERYGITDISLPALFILDGQIPKLLIDSDKMDACRSIADLKVLVETEVKKL